MFENEYKKLVLEDFDQKVKAGQLPSELISPTPGNLKSESVKICGDRFDSDDGIILDSFFGKKENGYAYRQAIQNSNVDVFRPLVNLLKNHSINTSLKNVNLLAWLIDFQPRPFHPNLIIAHINQDQININQDKIPDSSLSSTATDAAEYEADPVQPAPPSKKQFAQITKLIIACALLMVIASISYFVIDHSRTIVVTGREGCMFWQDNHYQPIDCSRRIFHFHTISINHKLVDGFKRITLPDTLTMRSLGKIWYAKFRGRVEFYTQGGAHPVDTNKRLLPVSDHILKKYVYHLTD
ncbi:MAG: hypothetical protein EOP45_16405 [Sphingobacteriaceae bacterium]|nr:MAG: hypothetical protein EOP45_16405 [Sphingobacteriaceae bacterium]